MSRVGNILRIICGWLLDRPTNFSWLVKGKLAGSGRPMSPKSLMWMKQQNIQAVLSLTEDELPEEWFSDLGLTHLHMPIADHSLPSVKAISQAVRFIEDQVSEDKAVAVHCNAGQGRTGTILAAYLIHSKALKPDEAITAVRRARPFSIERRQEKAVQEYFQWLHDSKS